MKIGQKIYLGDSVYVTSDGYGIWLTTENGYPDDPRNKIYMEPSVVESFRLWYESLNETEEK